MSALRTGSSRSATLSAALRKGAAARPSRYLLVSARRFPAARFSRSAASRYAAFHASAESPVPSGREDAGAWNRAQTSARARTARASSAR